MKSSKLFLSALAAAALLVAAALTTHAQNWDSVYDPLHDGIVGVCGDIGTDAAGNVYAVGRQIAPDGSSVAIVQGSSDQGAAWSVLDQYSKAGLSYAHNRAFAADRLNGNLFAGGNLNNLLPNGTAEFDTLWFIREWNPVTGTWSTAEDYSALVNDVGQSSCADIMVSPSGDVYATGGGQLGTGLGWLMGSAYNASTRKTYWVVRSSSDGGLTWSITDMALTGISVEARGIVEDTSGNLVVCGQVTGAAGGLDWIVRKGTQGTKLVKQGKQWIEVLTINWTTIDEYQFATGKSAQPNGITTDAHGNIYVGGCAQDASGINHWIVRKLPAQ